MNDRGRQLVMKYLLDPILTRSERYIGVELEFPLICIRPGADLKVAADHLLEQMIGQYECSTEIMGNDGKPVRVRTPEDDGLSFDYHYGQLEFSMWRSEDLGTLARRFFALYQTAGEILQGQGFCLTGLGTNPLAQKDNIALVPDLFTQYIGEFMKNYTSYHDNKVFFVNMYSNQTHIDIDGGQFLRAFNLMLRLNFVGGLLFSNSLPNQETIPAGYTYPEGTLCARDFNWKYSEFPAVGCFDREFGSVAELAEFLAEQELFIKTDRESGAITPMGKMSIRKYFADPDHQEQDIRLFRMFANVSLNHYHTLEFRSECVQPLADTFAPNAFYLGLVYNLDETEAVAKQFFAGNQITGSNSELRERAVTGQFIAADSVMKAFLRDLLSCANGGLLKRGFGEEQYLSPLADRIEQLSCPAKVMRERLAAGESLIALIEEWGTVR